MPGGYLGLRYGGPRDTDGSQPNFHLFIARYSQRFFFVTEAGLVDN